ncbi:HU family DNA-binding protein [Acidithiobacillus ferruginosus]|uniref:HU family DNA-binding protein n=1 Tax=Acidithiobacillus ferruginosus TaxID=3063951 RepID=UPI001C0660C0|nr:hypothetical protein [Acidithiobacillus ferruginosus]
MKLSGFGNFTLRDKRPRPGRNPKTGEMIPIAARLAACRAGGDVSGEPEGQGGVSCWRIG